MILTRLMLRHFRNYRQAELETDPRTNLFIGENAQGKTNLLEAVHVLALTKSHRTHKDRELVAWEEKEARIYGEVERKYGLCKLDLLFHAQGKRARINGLEQKKLSDFIGTLNVVMFAPEDLEIVKGSPGIRRRFMDMEIGQVQPNYVYLLARYLKVLHQRNQLLKQLQSNGHSDGALLEIWDRQLADYGSKIMKKRQNFITKLLIWAKKIHGGIAGDRETLEIEYQPSFDVEDFADESVLFEQFMIKLSHIRLQELKRGTTLIGPHRDDLSFYINGKEAQVYGSQGQQRTVALSVKLAEIELMREEVGEYPVLLLDDVLSELDRYRQTHLIETFEKKVQTFITATGIEGLEMDRLRQARVFRVADGVITEG